MNIQYQVGVNQYKMLQYGRSLCELSCFAVDGDVDSNQRSIRYMFVEMLPGILRLIPQVFPTLVIVAAPW